MSGNPGLRVARLWGVDALATLDECAHSGIAAVRMRVDHPCEVIAPVMDDVHVVSWALAGERQHSVWHDGRLVHEGDVPDRTINIVRAGVAPRAAISNGVDVLHLYVGRRRLETLAERLGYRGTQLELVDPRSAPDRQMGALADLLLTAMDDNHPTSRLFADEVGGALNLHLIRRHSNFAEHRGVRVTCAKGGLAPWQVKRLVEFMEERLADDVSLTDLSALLDLSTYHLCRAFKASTGLPPHRWRHQRRMERARELLKSTDLPVTEIAAQVGYDNPSQLSAAFKKAFGVNPSQYRREQR